MRTRIFLQVSLLTMTVALGGFGAEASDKPSCDSSQLGHFWPAEANSGSQRLYELSRTGELEICTRGAYRYHWKALTVSYQELLRAAKAKEQRARNSKNTTAEPSE